MACPFKYIVPSMLALLLWTLVSTLIDILNLFNNESDTTHNKDKNEQTTKYKSTNWLKNKKSPCVLNITSQKLDLKND